ncbi:hypothetical protein MVES1_002855 [Malassezia vespertilionis]|uniref:uncharacterized protein n=1 Tax=Malassezia vespertilionis TaxID=2020962 RepID=UPI0024B283A5|nr:uncharacterized protein MVES1_002855 [Malassezia vespertilionis]WFD07489.1 hypothetical protein MVES1_002855 [Malassezia vespertilionis]
MATLSPQSASSDAPFHRAPEASASGKPVLVFDSCDTTPVNSSKDIADKERVYKAVAPDVDGQLLDGRDGNGSENVDEEKGDNKDGPIIVKWDDIDDKERPLKWSLAVRLYLTILGGLITLASTFASSAPSFVIPGIMNEFEMKNAEVAKASVFLFVGGYCTAPLIWGPLSEYVGRRWTFVASFVGFTCFNVGCMLAPNIASLIVFRIFAGAFASCPLSNVIGMIAELYSFRYLTIGAVMFCIAPMAGPCLGPIVGGYIMQSGASWRWVFRALACASFVLLLLLIFTMPETLGARCLQKKAKRIRKETGDDRYKAPVELVEGESKLTIVKRILAKPFILFFQEPMLIATTIYMSFVYGTLYLLFDAYPIVFGELHDLKPGSVGLAFLGYFVGCCAAGAYCVFVDNRMYLKALDANNGMPPPPEIRLRAAAVGAPLLVISLFWFAWTSFPSVSFWSPLVAGGVFGAAMYLIFLGLMVYITEVYIFSASSAVAANTVVRSAFGVGFPMFGEQMYHNLNPRWASTVLGFIALAMLPIPFVLMKYGPSIRKLSKFAQAAPGKNN